MRLYKVIAADTKHFKRGYKMNILKFFKIPDLQEPQETPTRPTGDSDADIIRDTLIKRAANLLFYNNPRSKRDFWTECEHMTDAELTQIIRDFRG